MTELPNLGANHFDCVTTAGHFDSWKQNITTSSGLITGSVYFRSTWEPDQWEPNAMIVVLGKEHTDEVAGISYGKPPNLHKYVGVELEYLVPGSGMQTTWHKQLLANLGADMRFELRWSGDRVEARFPPNEQQWAPMPLAFVAQRVALVCSSAEVVFHDVSISSP